MPKNLLLAGLLALALSHAGPSGAADNTLTGAPGSGSDAGAAASSGAATDASGATAGAAGNAAAPTTSPGGVVIYPDDHVLGAASAPVTVVEYASLTCPHCAHFHSETFPKLKTDYIDQGKVRFVFRDYPLDRLAFEAALLAQCTPADRYFGMVDVLFRTQEQWGQAPDPKVELDKLARLGGLDPAALGACMADEAVRKKVLERRVEAEQKYGIQSTPSFVINGKLVQGALPFEQFEKSLKEALPKS